MSDFVVTARARTAAGPREVWAIAVYVPADLVYFRGHFEGDPVLPGVAQLAALALPEVARAWPDLTSLRRVTRLKFKRPIRPDARVTLRLERAAGAPRVRVELARGDASLSEAVLEFAVTPRE